MALVPVIGVTLGCPSGVGAEVVARALSDHKLRNKAHWVLLGSANAWADACRLCKAKLRVERGSPSENPSGAAGGVTLWAADGAKTRHVPGKPNARADACTAVSLRMALRAARAGTFHAVATGPARKQAFQRLPGGPFPGHTELFHHALGTTPVPVMLFVTTGMRLALHTIHVPLKDVPRLVTQKRLMETLQVLHDGLTGDLGLRQPVVDVLGLNPHASEGGLLGREDLDQVAPAVAQCRAQGWATRGPFPADGYFARYAGRADPPAAVLALYHDQGLAPFKLWENGRGCQMTLGLCVPRTSCDHGTAYDVAGLGVADARSMGAALGLAVQVARRRAR